MEDLFSIIHEECNKAVWSRGVSLSRKDSVTADSYNSEEAVLRVFDRATSSSALVNLLFEEEDWTSECSCKADPCHHVVAALIALKQSIETGKELPKSKTSSGKIVYHLDEKVEGLYFSRKIMTEGTLKDLNGSVRYSTGFTPTDADKKIDDILGSLTEGVFPEKVMLKIFKELSQVEVFLNSKLIEINKKALSLQAVIRDEASGINIKGRLHPEIITIYKNGCALSKLGLHPAPTPNLTQGEMKLLKLGRFFAASELTNFVSGILPSIEEKIEVIRESKNLPEKVSARPKVDIMLEKQGELLKVTPTIIYGSPVAARLIHGELHIIDGKVPTRCEDDERKLIDRVYRQLGLDFEKSSYYRGERAVDFVKNLNKWHAGTLSGSGLKAFSLHPPLQADLKIKDDGFNISFDSSDFTEKKKAKSTDVLSAWQAGESLVPLIGVAGLKFQKIGCNSTDSY